MGTDPMTRTANVNSHGRRVVRVVIGESLFAGPRCTARRVCGPGGTAIRFFDFLLTIGRNAWYGRWNEERSSGAVSVRRLTPRQSCLLVRHFDSVRLCRSEFMSSR